MTLAALLASGCGRNASTPFGLPDAGQQDGAAQDAPADVEPDADASRDAEPSLGRPCLDDPQCDDGIDCTFDRCDPQALRCRHEANDLSCQDGRHCNGAEICDLQIGCTHGPPVTCSDENVCTIDRCLEDDKSCEHLLRDADGDGDADWHCTGGSDCNDDDPLVHSQTLEICANSKDDDCDGEVDEPACGYPAHDTCAAPIELVPGEVTTISTKGAKLDYGASCLPVGVPSLRDAVAAITIPDGAPVDLDVTGLTSGGNVWISTAEQCGDASTELACARSSTGPLGSVARFVARKVQPGTYPVVVASDLEQDVTLRAVLRAAAATPDNETCGTAQPIATGTAVNAEIVGVATDLETACPMPLGELVYSFNLDEPHDVYVHAGSLDGLGMPTIGLRGSGCVDVTEEVGCVTGVAPALYRRALPAGTYFVAISATAATTVSFHVEVRPPTQAPADEGCEGAPALAPNRSIDVALDAHMDDLSCLAGAPDAVYGLELEARSDVLLVGRLTQGDEGAVSLWEPPCEASQRLRCDATTPSPVRTAMHDVAPGSYRAAIESRLGNPTRLTAFVRPAIPPTFVVFADSCDDAQQIPAGGGLFQGNTANATAQYGAGCDQAGSGAAGARDQMLRLALTERRRVVLDMRGSSYRTLLNVRRGPICPGTEITNACAVGYYAQRSFLDLTLDAGVYYVQVDGFYGEAGSWFLDVFVVEP